MKTVTTLAGAAVIAALAGATPAAGQFDHAKHRPMFPSCTACHAGVAEGNVYPEVSFCSLCHDGRTQPEIDWSAPVPGSQANLRFRHGAHPMADQCANCHVQGDAVQRVVLAQCFACHGITEHFEAPDCSVCHVQPPAPTSHTGGFVERHGAEAASGPETCATCHVRADCLECHRPGGASPAGGYHDEDYLARHPTDAYSQASQCSDCHNTGQFCQACHQQAGLAAPGTIGSGYHDAKRFFVAGHGQAARQSLESCVACHTENNCVRCHVNTNPHGRGFEAEKQRKANPETCALCHGSSIPGGE